MSGRPVTVRSRAGANKIASAGFSRRQAALLQGLYDVLHRQLGAAMERMRTELDEQLFGEAEQARSDATQRRLLETGRRVRENGASLTAAMLGCIETVLSELNRAPVQSVTTGESTAFSELTLVDTSVMDETVTLREFATRAEVRNSLPLFLLGQRLGVIAGAPAFDAEEMPLGPKCLCKALRDSLPVLGLEADQRGPVYEQFDRQVMQKLGPVYKELNDFLVKQGILPGLEYVPPRAHRRPQPAAARTAPEVAKPADPGAAAPVVGELPSSAPDMRTIPSRAGGHPGFAPDQAPGHAARPSMDGFPFEPAPGPQAVPARPAAQPDATPSPAGAAAADPGLARGQHEAGAGLFPPPGTPTRATARRHAPEPEAHPVLPWGRGRQGEAVEAAQDAELFETLRDLLAGRRKLLQRLRPGGPVAAGPAASDGQVQTSLARIQRRFNAQASGHPVPAFAEIKRELLGQLRQASSGEQPLQLSEQQEDTVELVGMLFDQIAHEVRPQTPGGNLLAQLQLPLLRVALQDAGFFVDRNNPARQMLEAVAETSAYWQSEDEIDHELIGKMGSLVKQVTANDAGDAGDMSLFRDLLADLSSHLNIQQRKAEVSERRHIEAARGREKLEIARLQAEEAVTQLLEGKQVPRFLQILLEQVWTDVLALALLRGGKASETFQAQFALAQRLVEAAESGRPESLAIGADESRQMGEDIKSALARVGHSATEAEEVCNRLLTATQDDRDEPQDAAVSRTELTAKLRTRTRLGESIKDDKPAETSEQGAFAPLTEEEQAWYARLKALPFGTWFDFTINQQGDRVRRRLSWFSTVTGHCLFVNHRGQRAGDYTLQWLAREMQRGNVSLAENTRDSIVDRAWKAIIKTLRSFSAGGSAAAPSAG